MVPHLIRRCRRAVEFLNDVKFATRERNGCLDTVVALRTGRLHATTALRAVRSHVLNIDRGGDYLYVREGELRALSDNAPVECYHRAAIVIQPVAVASLLVRVEVHAAELYKKKQGVCWRLKKESAAKPYLESSFFNELDASVELPKFVVTPTRVCENLDTIEAHKYMRATNDEGAIILWHNKEPFKSVTSQV